MKAARARVEKLTLRDFRNFAALELAPPEEGFVAIGENGQGKTNLLEAIYYFSLLRSIRGARDADVARFGAGGFYVEALVHAPARRELSIGFEKAGRRKRVRRDGSVVERLSDALGALPAVMFAPGDVELVAGAPSARRRYLDIMLAVSSRGYLNALQLYRGALERRNAALREAVRHGRADTRSIEVWEEPLAQHGASLIRTRRSWVARMSDRFADRCAAIGEQGAALMAYETSVDANAESIESELANALAARRATDVRMGITGAGPHRDDLTLTLDGRRLRDFGSAGQQRTAAIALRTLEAETLRESHDVSPVFLLDDPFAELDPRRSERVLRLLRSVGLGQTFLTVPRESDIPADLVDMPRYRITAGSVSEER